MHICQDRGIVEFYLKTHYPVIIIRTFNLMFLNEVLKKNSMYLMQKKVVKIAEMNFENSIFFKSVSQPFILCRV